jgi:uncharacterized protein (TIGR02679 family)
MTGGMTGGCPLARPELAPLVDELARRFGAGDVPAMLTLRDHPARTRHALADLFGQDRLPPPSSRIRVSRLVGALGLDSVTHLRAVVESLRGPLPDRRSERVAEQAARDELWAGLAGEALSLALFVGGAPGSARAWVDRLRSQGARDGVDAHRRRLERALAVLRALPAGGIPLAALANDLLDNPHALDRGRRLAAIVLDAVALAGSIPLAGDAASARQLWESVGVAPDPLSSTVLVVGLGVEAPPPLGPWLRATRAVGEPVVLTLAQLRRWPVPALAVGKRAYVVENPSLVAEAARLGWAGPPIVCSSGRPTVAVVTLVRQLAAAGAEVLQHADFDATGLAITGWLAARAATTPWRMSSADYLAAASRRSGQATLETLPPTPWDPGLHTAMAQAGHPVYEEELRTELLQAMVEVRER